MRTIQAGFAVCVLAALAACGTQPVSSSAGNSTTQPPRAAAHAAPPPGAEAQPPAVSVRNAPPGTSVYSSSTYNQSGYTYPAGTPPL